MVGCLVELICSFVCFLFVCLFVCLSVSLFVLFVCSFCYCFCLCFCLLLVIVDFVLFLSLFCLCCCCLFRFFGCFSLVLSGTNEVAHVISNTDVSLLTLEALLGKKTLFPVLYKCLRVTIPETEGVQSIKKCYCCCCCCFCCCCCCCCCCCRRSCCGYVLSLLVLCYWYIQIHQKVRTD